jgi:hypothetical protein
MKWLAENAEILSACAQSMRNRADPRTGVMAYDSARCRGGQEITTYDSLDVSLGQARGNTYLAAKCWAAWVGLEMLGSMRGDDDADDSLADVLASFLSNCAAADGVIPAVLEKDSTGHRSRILPVIEALMYPHYWQNCLRGGEFDSAQQMVSRALRSPLVKSLRQHASALLTDPQHRNVFADGGIKLSSTSDNSWMSKIALVQHVAREVLRLHEHDTGVAALFRSADAAHVRWQTDGAAYWACSDQFVNGVAKASRYYPRMITAALWLNETSGVTVDVFPAKQPTGATSRSGS